MEKVILFINIYFKLIVTVCAILATLCYIKIAFEKQVLEQVFFFGVANDKTTN